MPNREIYLFLFPNMEWTNYWFKATCQKFQNDVVYIDSKSHRIVFLEADYYFCSEQMWSFRKCIRPDYVFDPEAIYIILDDPERFRIVEE